MTGSQLVSQTIQRIPENELIFASKLYSQQLSDFVSESASVLGWYRMIFPRFLPVSEKHRQLRKKIFRKFLQKGIAFSKIHATMMIRYYICRTEIQYGGNYHGLRYY